MELKKTAVFTAAFLAVLAASFLAGCTDGEGRTISISGSTTVFPIIQNASEAWMDSHPDDEVLVSAGGSSVGIKAVGEGTADIGMASRELKSEEKTSYPGLVKHVIAKDGIAVIVHKDNAVSSLTKAQVKGIYNGTYTNWKDVGGADKAIVLVGRDSASGTKEAFGELVMGKQEPAASMQQKNSNGAVKTTVAETPGAIGYVSISYVGSDVKGVKIDGVEPTVANVKSGAYPVSRELLLFTDGEATGLSKDFIDFVKGPAGQKLVEEQDYVPL